MSEERSAYFRRLAELLGGGGEIRDVDRWHEQILVGLPFEAVENVKSRASLTDADMARLLGIGEATLRRARASRSKLDSTVGDRLYRLSKAIAVAEEVLGSEAGAISWLRRAQPGLGGRVPLELLRTHAGADRVETLLRRIDYGVYT
ncbi:MAG TPA: antitoxin Xre/MbcA/ParS toxin-binding domain-containing protein [Gammaproteobacteria bacterium]|nr:antitoxin Xre/MbcA/ParS toxin-binding domain-containing protein [Gammaproteobacteria bacterium]